MIITLGEETGLILCQSDIITLTEKDEGSQMGATLHGLQYSFKIQIDVKCAKCLLHQTLVQEFATLMASMEEAEV